MLHLSVIIDGTTKIKNKLKTFLHTTLNLVEVFTFQIIIKLIFVALWNLVNY